MKWLSTKQAERFSGYSRTWLEENRKKGNVKFRKSIGGRHQYDSEQLKNFINDTHNNRTLRQA